MRAEETLTPVRGEAGFAANGSERLDVTRANDNESVRRTGPRVTLRSLRCAYSACGEVAADSAFALA